MYKTLKYIYESGNTVLKVILIIFVLFCSYFMINQFSTTFIYKSKVTQGLIIEKNEKNSFFNKSYEVVIKDKNNNTKSLTTTKREFDLLNENKQYVLKVKNNTLLYALTKTGDEYLATNNLTKDDISLSHSNGEDINKETATATAKPTDKPTESDKPSKTDGAIENNEYTNVASKSMFMTTANQEKIITIQSFGGNEYNSSVTIIGGSEQEITCSNVDESFGACNKSEDITTWTIKPSTSSITLQVKVYSDNQQQAFVIK